MSVINGTSGDDSLFGEYIRVDDTIYGNDGNDLIAGGRGFTFGLSPNFYLGAGFDYLSGGNGDDTIYAATIYDRQGDTIEGGAGDDLIVLGLGADSVDAGSGNDRIEFNVQNNPTVGTSSGIGSNLNLPDLVDTIDGGTGVDVVDFSTSTSAVWVNLIYTGSDVWTRDGSNVTTGTWREIADLDGVENIIGSDFDDQLYGDDFDNVIDGGEGSDLLEGRHGDDTIKLSASLSGNLDTMDGGAGNDTADFSEFSSAVWVGLSFNGVEAWTRDTTNLDVGTYRTIADLEGIENVVGSSFDDLLYGDASNNVLTGGAGSDSFAFLNSFGSDTVSDFELGVDTLQFASVSGINSAQDVLNVTSYSGGDATIVTAGGTIELTGISSGLTLGDIEII